MNTLLVSAPVSRLASGLVALADKVPSDDQIGAGWWYFLLFVALAAAVTFLGFSLSKQLRKTRANAERGVFGDGGKPTR